jgi:malate dehydrogenase
MSDVIRVAVTGAAGQVAYAMLERLASGETFGPTTKVILQLLEIPLAVPALHGVAMELDDCSFPTLQEIIVTDDPKRAFRECNLALLIGGFPRKQGMERKDLLSKNAEIFIRQGRALADNAASDVRILVVANPCNTNCLIASHHGKDIPAERWVAMTRLDYNRSRNALARKAGVGNGDVTCLAIWGNHSNTQFPDFTNARIRGRPATEVITDRDWLEKVYVSQCQERGAAVIKARGASSALSAGAAIVDHLKSLFHLTPSNDWIAAATISRGEYGVPPGLVFGYPCCSDDQGNLRVVEGLTLDSYGNRMFQRTLQELQEERAMMQEMLT